MNKYQQYSRAKNARQCGHGKPKIRYNSKAEAEAALELYEKIGVKRAYRCELCGYWHLTSHER